MEKELKTYKEYRIFVDSKGTFYALDVDGNRDIEAKTLDAVIEKIDKVEKVRVKGTQAIYRGMVVTITSISEDVSRYGGHRHEAWISYEEGGHKQRQKVCLSSLRKNTPSNLELLKKITAIEKQEEELETERGNLENQQEGLKPEDLGYTKKE